MRIALWKARTPAANTPGSYVGGARILNFERGWAVPVLRIRGTRAHWFERRGRSVATSLCDRETPLELVHGPGNYPRCGLCIRAMKRLIRTGAWRQS